MLPAELKKFAEKTKKGTTDFSVVRVYIRCGDEFGLRMDVNKMLVACPELGMHVVRDLQRLLEKLEEAIGGRK